MAQQPKDWQTCPVCKRPVKNGHTPFCPVTQVAPSDNVEEEKL